MQQIPCRIYDLKNEFTQDPVAARYKLAEQVLTGDSTDGYSGCPGIGPKRAGGILSKVKNEQYWPAIVETYEAAGCTEEDAIRNLRLANILKADNWNTETQAPILITTC